MLHSRCSKTCGYKAAGTREESGVSRGNLLYETDPSVNNKVNTCYSMKTVAVPKVPRNTVWLASRTCARVANVPQYSNWGRTAQETVSAVTSKRMRYPLNNVLVQREME